MIGKYPLDMEILNGVLLGYFYSTGIYETGELHV